jgi:hypothetical protein
MSRNTKWGDKLLLRKIYTSDCDNGLNIAGWVLLIINVLYLIANVCGSYTAREFVSTYPETKEFLERTGENDLESFAFREKMLEKNEALFEYQWKARDIPNWTFVSEEVLNFEPIK